MDHVRFIGPALLVAVSLSASPVRAAEVAGRSPHIVDGDTIDLAGARIRLEGIDAPEARQKCKGARGGEWNCGQAAARRLEAILSGSQVRCGGGSRDDYGRLIATCFVEGRNVNAQMIREGLAWAFVKYSSTYVGAEEEARRSKRGVFQVANVPPWDFRAAQSKAAEQSASQAPGSCAIKGNISDRGARIYHKPGQRDYERVRINEKIGERWFCSETEAETAGWRKAQR